MSASMSDYLRNALMKHVAGTAAFTAPVTWYFSLHTTPCTSATPGTECTGGSYVRKSVPASGANFGVTANQIASTVDAIFAVLSGSIGTPVAWAVFDAAAAGNMLFWGDLAGVDQKLYVANDQPMIPAGNFTATLT